MKKRVIIILLLMFIFALNVSDSAFRPFYNDSNISYSENNIKNTILIIGDGMGENHINAARAIWVKT